MLPADIFLTFNDVCVFERSDVCVFEELLMYIEDDFWFEGDLVLFPLCFVQALGRWSW